MRSKVITLINHKRRQQRKSSKPVELQVNIVAVAKRGKTFASYCSHYWLWFYFRLHAKVSGIFT